ncbi:uncharacterized protein LOC129732323 [Wyeomyia smithii]|uniref:uncharacterized protein LOC129732323 n=1 Tax=Wyeomyia smithii TaxID=174621 RepID=UPI002467F7E4|nr:uncharacterized protein LOC129732323 [Wyeomyia smithii]
MKLVFSITSLWVILYLHQKSCYGAVNIIEPEMYIQKLVKRFVEMLEIRYLSNDLPIDDYVAPINISSYGIAVVGNVSFHSAFVARIGSIKVNLQQISNVLLSTEMQINTNVFWEQVGVVLDFQAELEGYRGPGTLMVTYKQFRLPLKTSRTFATGQLSGSLLFESISNQNEIEIVGHPNDVHVQMIARAIITDIYFRRYMIASFERWNFQNVLSAAMQEIPYPEICYNC